MRFSRKHCEIHELYVWTSYADMLDYKYILRIDHCEFELTNVFGLQCTIYVMINLHFKLSGKCCEIQRDYPDFI
jgi:hypothetical protein